MRTLGLRGRVILGFAAGALLLSVLVTLVTDVVSARYLVDQRERAASRQAVVNGLFVESRLTRDGADPSGALGAVRLGTGAEAVLVAPEASASTAIGLTSDDLPTDLVAATEAGQPSVQISRSGGTPVVTVGVPLQGGYAYYEVTELENLDTTLQTIIWAGVAAALLTSLLGAASAGGRRAECCVRSTTSRRQQPSLRLAILTRGRQRRPTPTSPPSPARSMRWPTLWRRGSSAMPSSPPT